MAPPYISKMIAAAELTTPDIELLIHNEAGTPKRSIPGFIIGDILGDEVNLGMGDSYGVQYQNPTIQDSWLQFTQGGNDTFKQINNLMFVRFKEDGTVSTSPLPTKKAIGQKGELSGFVIQPREALLDFKIMGDETLSGGNFAMHFEAIQGDYETIKQPKSPKRTGMRNISSGLTHKIASAGNLPESRSWFFEVDFTQQNAGNVLPSFRAIWGLNYSVLFREGQNISIETRVNGKWSPVRVLSGFAPADTKKGKYHVGIFIIAGRLMVDINGYKIHQLFYDVDSQGHKKPVDVTWYAAPLQFNCYNVVASVSGGVIKYSTPDDTPYQGFYTRSVACNVKIKNATPEVQISSGWKRGGTDIAITDATYNSNAVGYTCTLTGSAAGIHTPFVSKVNIQFSNDWGNQAISALNPRRAIKQIEPETAMPPTMAGGEMTVTLDRQMLDENYPNWQDYISEFRYITFRMRRRVVSKTSGSAALVAAGTDTGNYVGMFAGYIYRIKMTTEGVNKRSITLTCRDSILRMQAPASAIDHRYPPLDFIFAQQNPDQLSSAGGAIYGEDCVRQILTYSQGAAEAAKLNGAGSAKLRFFDAHGKYPILDFTGDTAGYFAVMGALAGQPPTNGGFMLPAPYGDDAVSWIKKFGDIDGAEFFYARTDDNFPVPIYGRMATITQSIANGGIGRNYVIPDAAYSEAARQILMLSLETENRPDVNFNRWLAWSNPGGMEASEFLPAWRMAEAQLPPGDPNSAQRSWERTQILKEELAWVPGAAERLVTLSETFNENRDMRWPTISIRGIPVLQWGDTLTFNLSSPSSDSTINMNSKTFLAGKVRHIINMDGTGGVDQFTSQVSLQPLPSGSGLGG